MTETEKQQFYQREEELLAAKQQNIAAELKEIPQRLAKVKELRDGSTGGELTYLTVASANRKKFDELEGLYPSPYFNRLKLQFDGEAESREIFIGKFTFGEENIYSWTSPIAVVRFDRPGNFSLAVEDENQAGQILTKDQYLINEGKILFLAHEQAGRERELIYQEYFSQRKTTFVLPEIVAQMEKAQDEVIRARAEGPLVICGPAGSGKTTLALHRVAYLLQSPDTAAQYQQDKIIVLVQDALTKNYFSGLLPSFGINDVTITTFGEWALDVLDLSKVQAVIRYLANDRESNYYEAAKTSALRAGVLPSRDNHDPFTALHKCYEEFMTAEQLKYFARQKKEAVLDRFDLTLLVMAQVQSEPLTISRQYYQVGRTRELTNKTKRTAPDYSLVVVDEFENYLPEQIDLIKRGLNHEQSSILYVGDLKQQIYYGSLKAWHDLGEEFAGHEKLSTAEHNNIIRLQKVYRNTQGILRYAKQLGYDVEIPESLRPGSPVEEVALGGTAAELPWLEEKIARLPDVSIGILAKDKDYLTNYQTVFKDHERIKVMSIHEAQGVEFDAVFLVGMDKQVLHNDASAIEPDELSQEFWRISRDLIYIGLTRAMNELYVSVK